MNKTIARLLVCLALAAPAFAADPPLVGTPTLYGPNTFTSPQTLNNMVGAVTAHDEIIGTDGIMTAGSAAFASATATFTAADVGKTIVVNGAGAAEADLITTIAGFTDSHHVTLAATATYTTPWWQIGRANLTASGNVTTSYLPADTLTPSGGTVVGGAAGVYTITSVQVDSATVNTGGTGGASGPCTVMGTTGVTRSKWTTAYTPSTSFFQATGTVTGGALAGALVVTRNADYSTPPTSVTTAPMAATFTNGSAVITATNTLAAGTPVQFTTSGTLPSGFALATTYYVSATGLSGSVFEVATTLTGNPIVAGSAGSGTWTATVVSAVIPVTGCAGLVNATVSLKMAPYMIQPTTAGHYTALPGPTGIATTTNGSGVGATISIWGQFPTGVFLPTVPGDPVGGYWAYGTDDTAAINTAVKKASDAGGGTVVLPLGRSLMLGAFVIPYTGTIQPAQAPLRITGGGNLSAQSHNNYVSLWSAPLSGTMIDNRYAGGDGAGHIAKLDTRGVNTIQLDHFTFADYGTDNQTLFFTTNTTPFLEHMTWLGNPTCYRMTCRQAAIQLGPILQATWEVSSNSVNSVFQGYEATIRDSVFGQIEEAIQFGVAANTNQVFNINVDETSGSYSCLRGAIHFYGLSQLGPSMNAIYGGNIEMTGYCYGVVSTGTIAPVVNNMFYGLNFEDASGDQSPANVGPGQPTIGEYYFDAKAFYFGVFGGGQANAVATNAVTALDKSTYIGIVYSGSPFSFPFGLVVPDVLPSSNVGIQTKNTLSGLTYGDGDGSNIPPNFIINGTSSGTGGGSKLSGYNGGGLCWSLGSSSAVLGGAYSNGLVINANCSSFQLGTFGNPQEQFFANRVQFKTEVQFQGGTPTIGSGTCGTGANGTIGAGSFDQNGKIIINGQATAICPVLFSKTFDAAPTACTLAPANAAAAALGAGAPYVSPISTTGFTINAAALASTSWYYHCI